MGKMFFPEVYNLLLNNMGVRGVHSTALCKKLENSYIIYSCLSCEFWSTNTTSVNSMTQESRLVEFMNGELEKCPCVSGTLNFKFVLFNVKCTLKKTPQSSSGEWNGAEAGFRWYKNNRLHLALKFLSFNQLFVPLANEL